jgi:hypothetical protein
VSANVTTHPQRSQEIQYQSAITQRRRETQNKSQNYDTHMISLLKIFPKQAKKWKSKPYLPKNELLLVWVPRKTSENAPWLPRRRQLRPTDDPIQKSDLSISHSVNLSLKLGLSVSLSRSLSWFCSVKRKRRGRIRKKK